MKKLILILFVFAIAGCKSTEITTQETTRTQPQNLTVPVSVLQKGQGLTGEELRTIYAYALDMSTILCQRFGYEVTLAVNAEANKEKIAELDPKIEELQMEIDRYLDTDKRRIEAYQESMRTEMVNCKYVQGEWQ